MRWNVWSSWVFHVVLAIIASTMPSSGQAQEQDVGRGMRILVQSEFDYLESSNRRITIDVKDASPDYVLAQIGKKAQFAIEVQGRLPEAPKLTASFRDATVREILQWFSEKLRVSYRAEGPNKLTVIPRVSKTTP